MRTGGFTPFDAATQKIDARRLIASGSLPPGFPATEIDGEYYWDGGVVSNSILRIVLDASPRRSTLAFQIDVWNASGEPPQNLIDVYVREKDIRYASRSNVAIDHLRVAQRLRHAIQQSLASLPDDLRKSPDIKRLVSEADEAVYNVVHLIYNAKRYEGASKDYDFSLLTLNEHWRAGHEDASRAISHSEAFERPTSVDGFRELVFLRADAPLKLEPPRVLRFAPRVR